LKFISSLRGAVRGEIANPSPFARRRTSHLQNFRKKLLAALDGCSTLSLTQGDVKVRDELGELARRLALKKDAEKAGNKVEAERC